MAEVALKIGDSDTYKDGDILCAFNRRRTRCVHAEHVCWPRVNGVKIGGNVGNGHPLLRKMFERTQQYKWERVSWGEIMRTNLATSDTVTYGSTPVEDPDRPGHMIHCNVDEHFAFRAASGKTPVWGEMGSEIEFGGHRDVSNKKLDLVWADIEAGSDRREAEDEFQLWPAGRQDIREFLFVHMEAFSDAEADALVAPQYDELGSGAITAHRANGIDWRKDVLSGLGVTEAQVLDPRYAVGDDVTFPSGTPGHRSKAQPIKDESVIVVKPTEIARVG